MSAAFPPFNEPRCCCDETAYECNSCNDDDHVHCEFVDARSGVAR